MAIDPSVLSQVVWDDEPPAGQKPLEIDITGGVSESQLAAQQAQTAAQQPIDLSQVVWDDEPSTAAQPVPNPLPASPTDNMSNYERFMAGAGKSVADSAMGATQVLSSPIAPLLNPVGGAITYALGQRTDLPQQLASRVAEQKQLDAPLMSTTAGISGNVAGTLAQILGPGALARGTAAAPLLLPRTVAGNALQGLAIGAAQPAANAQDRGLNTLTGGLGGGLGAVAGKAIGATLGAGKNALASLTGRGVASTDRAAGQALLREATNPNAISITPSAVPGVNRTLGEATLDPGLMALENTMRASRRGAFEQIDTANNTARVAQLENIAGTPQQMAAAKSARAAASGSARDQAMAAGIVDVSQTVSQLSDAIKAAQGRPAVQDGLSRLRGLLIRGADEEGKPILEDRIAVLDNVRQTIGDMLSGKYGGESAAALKGARELIDIRDALNSEIGGQVPSFAQYLDAYRSASAPINRMQMGQRIIRDSSGAVKDGIGNPRLTPAAFSKSSNDLDSIAAKATGFKKARAADILTKDDISAINAIQEDMRRQFARQSSATVGSQTSERTAIGARIGQKAAMRLVPGLKDAAAYVEEKATERLKERLAYLMANPAEARRVLGALSKQDSDAVRRVLSQLAFSGGTATATSANNARGTTPP